MAEKLEHPLSQLGERARDRSPREAAEWTALPEGIAVAVGNVDAHVTSPAAQAIAPGQMLAVMGTSTCHVMNGDHLAEVPGMCGVVHDGIVPGLYGYEAGQSGVGDIFGWFVAQSGPARLPRGGAASGRLASTSTCPSCASRQRVGEHGLVALDWHSGNRSVLVDHELSGMIVGLTLATRAGGRLPGAARGDRVRHAQDHRVLRGGRAARARSSSSPAACSRTRS